MGQKLVTVTAEFWVDKSDGYGLVEYGDTTRSDPRNFYEEALRLFGMCEHPSELVATVHLTDWETVRLYP